MSPAIDDSTKPAITIGPDRATRIVLIAGFPIAGALLGWALPHIADWLESQPWAPFQGPARLIASWDGSWATIGLIMAGVIAGGLFGLIALDEEVKLTIGATELVMVKGSTRTVFPQSEVTSLFFDGGDLVVAGNRGVEIHRTQIDADRDAIGNTLQEYGWPFLREDPISARAQPWVPMSSRLPDPVNEILESRAQALARKDDDEVQALTRELGTHGYAVRVRSGQQHIARLDPGADGSPGQ